MNFNRLNKSQICPKLLSLCEQLVINCEKRGYTFFAISGFRSAEEQSKLYAQGRSTAGKIVTNAKAFQSLHNFGLAIDFCHDLNHNKTDGLQPSWDMKAYEVLGEEARKLGLVTGLDFKSFREGPHIQLKTDKSLLQLKELFDKGGLSEVWLNV